MKSNWGLKTEQPPVLITGGWQLHVSLLQQFRPDLGVEVRHLRRAGLEEFTRCLEFRRNVKFGRILHGRIHERIRSLDAICVFGKVRDHRGIFRIHDEVQEQLGIVDDSLHP